MKVHKKRGCLTVDQGGKTPLLLCKINNTISALFISAHFPVQVSHGTEEKKDHEKEVLDSS